MAQLGKLVSAEGSCWARHWLSPYFSTTTWMRQHERTTFITVLDLCSKGLVVGGGGLQAWPL